MRPIRHALVPVLLFVLCGGATAYATDQALAGAKLLLKHDDTLRLTIQDTHTTVPAAGSPDDPTAHGMELLLSGRTTPPGHGSLTVPPGVGWRTTLGRFGAVEYGYRATLSSDLAPVRALRFRAGKGLKIAARRQPLPLNQPQGAVGVVVRFGDSAVCTIFGGTAVRRDVDGIFSAGMVTAPPFTFCSDYSFYGASCAQDGAAACGGTCPNPDETCAGYPGLGCTCISSVQPCGGTAPACNGECPEGEACTDVGGVPLPGCACLPAGSTGCGGSYGACGGDCPAGTFCASLTYKFVSGCGCTDGALPCGGPCPPGAVCVGPPIFTSPSCVPNTPCNPANPTCPAGTACQLISGISFYCVGVPCSGGSAYPTCGGSCDAGLSCQGFAGGGGGCYCAP